MDPKRIYELIIASQAEYADFGSDFEVSEILEEYSAVDKAMKELEHVVRDIENQNSFNDDFTAIDRKLHEKKIAMEFASVDAGYEL